MNVNYVKVYSDHLPVSFKKKPTETLIHLTKKIN